MRPRDRLSAGGKEIRTAGPSRRNGAFQNSILSTLVLAGRRSARLTNPPRARPQLASQEAAENAGRGGLPKVERAAARIFRLAADQRDAAAQAKLGFFYQEGLGGACKGLSGRALASSGPLPTQGAVALEGRQDRVAAARTQQRQDEMPRPMSASLSAVMLSIGVHATRTHRFPDELAGHVGISLLERQSTAIDGMDKTAASR